MDGTDRNLTPNAVGLRLLPSELLQDIFSRLSSPEIILLTSVSKTLASVITTNDFRYLYNSRSISETWLFVYTKRSARNSTLHGFNDRSNRWFRIPVDGFLSPAVPPGEDLYFLTASGDYFLFASNNRGDLIALNVSTNAVRRIPMSPLGPRGTSSWRRSGLKLIAGPPGSESFRFFFAELYKNRPVLFSYWSENDTWQSLEASERERTLPRVNKKESAFFLSVIHRQSESLLINYAGRESDTPIIFRPRFSEEMNPAVAFIAGDLTDQLHVYGDGYMAVIRSDGVDEVIGLRVFNCIEVWGLRLDGAKWEFITKVEERLIERIKKPFSVMVGCLEERNGVVRVVLVSNCKGLWNLIWLNYDLETRDWSLVPLLECAMDGLNMAESKAIRTTTDRFSSSPIYFGEVRTEKDLIPHT